MSENNGWKSQLDSFLKIEKQYEDRSPYAIFLNYFGHIQVDANRAGGSAVCAILQDEIGKRLSKKIIYPVYNAAYFRFSYLIDNLIHNRYPVAIPKSSKNLSGHSMDEMNVLSFAMHDLSHALIDKREYFLKE